MAKTSQTDHRPVEQMKLDIEFADNGIILSRSTYGRLLPTGRKNPDIEDEVTLALTGKGTRRPEGYGYDIDHSDEYRALGKKLYDWLTDEAIPEHADEWITTGAHLHITATLQGREM